MRDDLSLSLRAACAVMAGEGMGENAQISALQALKGSGAIRDGRVMLSAVTRQINRLGKEAAQ